MEYQVLARKWRPKTFTDMIGQEHITRTLQNALLNQKTAHAYLFVGPRGIGKTTVARIFAKTLNCEKAPVSNPCCECNSCLTIAGGNNIDIIEIDGASNNSVNDIRNLRDEVLYSPVNSRYKVYIIDEVHMLSNQAWNALLKTLEEPPAHVKFLFATTEVHKILPTVLSRCQRFDLRRIPENLIAERLSEIAVIERVKVSQNAIRAIARAADGGMRDALSLMDQMIAFHLSDDSEEISEEQILNTFGLTAPSKIFNIVKAILNNDPSQVIIGINEQAIQGKNLENLFQDVLKYLRGIEICMLIRDADSILEVGTDIIEKYKKLGAETKLHIVQNLLETLSSSGRFLHDAINKQIYIETLLLKAMRQANAVRIEDLLEKINILRKNGKFSDLEIELPDTNVIKKNISNNIEIYETKPAIDKQKKGILEQSVITNSQETSTKDSISSIIKEHGYEETLVKEDTPAKKTVQETVSEEIKKVPMQSENSEIKSQIKPSDNINIDFITGKNIDDINKTNISNTKIEIKESLTEPEENIYNSQEIFHESQDSNSSSGFEIDNYIELPKKKTINSLESDIKIPLPPVSEVLQSSEQKAKEVNTFNSHLKVTDSAEKLWHKLILEMDKINQPQLKFYLQEAKPKSISNTFITICYDEEFGAIPAQRIIQEKDIINKCLQRITGVHSFIFKLIKEKGIASPSYHIDTKDLDEIKKIVENNSFVNKVIKTFEGRIVDFRGQIIDFL